ncbi:MAG: bifunctional DNA-formamidopyrimidine glycosylase/DNA-(apurinic or apyrimidinic site) lyase [bacterium]
MPELPEVETVRRDLALRIVGKKISEVEVRSPKLVRNKLKDFVSALQGNEIKEIKRRAKLLVLELKQGYLLIHLKMTGQLIYRKNKEIIAGGHSFSEKSDWQLPNKYSHLIFTFIDGSQLFFNDLRQFGYLQLVEKKELEKILKAYGIEPLTEDFTFKNFKEALGRRKTAVKIVLMDQSLIAGLGNIYASEICFFAEVRPNRPVDSLTEKEIKDLYRGCKIILRKAIAKRGTTSNNYVDASGQPGNFAGFLKVYQRDGEKCQRCKNGIIKKKVIGGRGSFYCDKCQF